MHWEKIDQRKKIEWQHRKETKVFEINSDSEFRHLRFNIEASKTLDLGELELYDLQNPDITKAAIFCFLSGSSNSGIKTYQQRTGFVLSSVFFLVILCSALWAGFDASRKKLTEYFDVLPLTFWLVFYISPLYILWMYLSWSSVPTSTEFWLMSLLLLFTNTCSNLLFISSLSLGELSRVIPILSMTPVFSLLIAVLFFGEDFAAYEIPPILLVVVGLIVTNVDLKKTNRD